MPVSKTRNRGKNHKRRPQLSEKEKHRSKVDQAVRDSYASIPGDSIAMAIAQQNKCLRDHLRDPREFYELLEMIQSNADIGTIERYGGLLQRSGTMAPYDATRLTYSLITYRTIERWKRIAQTYLVSAPVLDQILQSEEEIVCNPQDFFLPFKTFFVDLGVIAGTNQHEGIFVRQHDDGSQIDFTFVNGELITSITLGEAAHVKLPTDPAKRHLNNLEYVGFILTSVLRALRLDRELALHLADEDNFSHEHNEWRTYLLRPGEEIADFEMPHWQRLENGAITYRPRAAA